MDCSFNMFEFPRRNVTDWATYVGSDYIGPERTLIDIWSVDQEDSNVILTYAFSRDRCVPVFQLQKGIQEGSKILLLKLKQCY